MLSCKGLLKVIIDTVLYNHLQEVVSQGDSINRKGTVVKQSEMTNNHPVVLITAHLDAIEFQTTAWKLPSQTPKLLRLNPKIHKFVDTKKLEVSFFCVVKLLKIDECNNRSLLIMHHLDKRPFKKKP